MSDPLAVATDQAMQDSAPAEQPTESFLDLDFDDGEVRSFKDADELKSWAKEGVLRQKDYTKKTQSVAEMRRQLERQQEEHRKQVEKELDAIKEAKSKYDRYEDAFRKRPQILAQLDRLASQPASPEEIFDRSKGYADEQLQEVKKELEELKAARQREELERQRDEVYSRLSQRYEGFDQEAVNEMLNTLEEGNLEPLLDLAWKASRYNPEAAVQTEERVLEKLQRKQGAKIPAGGGGSPPKARGSTDPKDAYDEALRDYAGIQA